MNSRADAQACPCCSCSLRSLSLCSPQMDQDTGAVKQAWGAGAFSMPHMLTADWEGNVWLTGAWEGSCSRRCRCCSLAWLGLAARPTPVVSLSPSLSLSPSRSLPPSLLCASCLRPLPTRRRLPAPGLQVQLRGQAADDAGPARRARRRRRRLLQAHPGGGGPQRQHLRLRRLLQRPRGRVCSRRHLGARLHATGGRGCHASAP